MIVDSPTLSSLVELVWASIIGLPVEQVEGTDTPSRASASEETILAGVDVIGTWNGAVTFECSRTLGDRLARAMLCLGDDEAASVDDVRDALGEIANIAAGNLKDAVAAPSTLSVPSVIETAGFGTEVPGSSLSNRAWFSCGDEMFSVAVFEQDD
ncbi:MAG: chemotaxis protein CheX [Planctomycetota bacterium]